MNDAGPDLANEREERGFPDEEYASRLARLQAGLTLRDMDALLLTTPADICYMTGFLTRFWESPTRPWYVVVRQSGRPIAVIPEIGAALMSRLGQADIRTWSAPDWQDDGVTLLIETLRECAPGGQISAPDHIETHLRMPLSTLRAIEQRIQPASIIGDGGLMRAIRMVKSDREIQKIATACTIAQRAFARVPQEIHAGNTLAEASRRFQALCLEEGADWVSYLSSGAGPNGYHDVISSADDTALEPGDVLMFDTGLVRDGYFCDFDRNWLISGDDARSPDAQATHQRLLEATAAGFEAIRPGVTASDVFDAMAKSLSIDPAKSASAVGRFGHGLGLNLTEPPSFMPNDHTILTEGMVLTLEPSLETAQGRMMVHEENLVVTSRGATYLSDPSSGPLPMI